MKQVFSSYPDGIVGLALLLLRGSAAALMVASLNSLGDPKPWIAVPIIVIIAAIGLGLGTRPAAVLCAVIAVPILLATNCVPALLVLAQGFGVCGLVLLGPGAVSIDARLFGRRKISLTK